MRRVQLTLLLGLSLALVATGCGDDDTNPTDTDVAVDGDTGDPDVEGDAGTDTTGGDSDQAAILSVDETEAWELDGLSAPVHVVRVEGSIPHIYAENRDDLGRALGFTVARDRYLIMDLQRRLGLGTLSSLLGQQALPNDMENTYIGMRAVSAKVLESLTAEHQSYLDAFAGGVNAYIAQVAEGNLPPPSELSIFAPALGFSKPSDMMAPFDRASVAAMVAVIMYETNFGTSDPGRAQRALQLPTLFDSMDDADATKALRKAGTLEIWNDLTPTFPVASAPTDGVTTNSGALSAGDSSKPGRAATISRKALERTTHHLDRLERRFIRDKEEGFGSNAWAVGSEGTANGAALVAGDGHLQLSMPALFWQVGMNTKVFGDGDLHQTGMLLTALPLLAVGTNGKVAWSQVNPVSDTTDWYAEELQLDADGAPMATKFDGEWVAVVAHDEEYDVANVPLLGSVGRTETHTRYVTNDGRWIFSYEGEVVDADYTAAAGETVLNVMGDLIVPKDMDGDGIISAVSFDWTGFEGAGYVAALDGFGQAETVEEMADLHRGQVGGGLYTAAADSTGSVLFASFQGQPCRKYLDTDASGAWTAGSDPTMVLDGTRYAGFEIPLDDNNLADGSVTDDPYRCVVPLSGWPSAIDPATHFVSTANNQPGPVTNDGTFAGDPWYLGGPWAAFRADTIERELEAAVADKSASIERMAEIQANAESRLGELFIDDMLAALANARDAASGSPAAGSSEERQGAVYAARAAQFDAVETRLKDWRDGNFQTPSGVETFYHSPIAVDRDNAVATMIFNAWLPRVVSGVFNDEGMDAVFRFSGSRMRVRWLRWMLDGRGANNPAGHACWYSVTQECAYFDRLDTAELETADEIIVTALSNALAFLEGPTDAGGQSGGFNTTDMDQWLWGLRHQARFESLLSTFLGDDPTFGILVKQFSLTTDALDLAESIPEGDPRRALDWFPRGGDNWGVDAGNPGFSGTRFTHGSGPVMRMVIELNGERVSGQNIIPGGQSALTTSEFHNDQAQRWLGNETYPFRFHIDQVVEGAVGREVLSPPAE